MFTRATKDAAKLRLALIGPSGSGKTFTALSIAQHLGDRVALIDTEHGSASKYADLFRFDTAKITSFDPINYINYIEGSSGADGSISYDVLIIDSLSHAWKGKDGVLQQVDAAAKRNHGNSFGAWRDVTPKHNDLIDAMLRCPCHLIVTMRAKTKYAMEEVERDGRKKTVVRKLGMEAIQREGLEYEFDTRTFQFPNLGRSGRKSELLEPPSGRVCRLFQNGTFLNRTCIVESSGRFADGMGRPVV